MPVDIEDVAVILAVSLLFTVVVFGNALILWIIFTDRRFKSIQYIYYSSLAVADFLLGVTVLPFSLLNEILGHWILSIWLCVAWLSMDVLLCTASILSLCLISLDRFWLIRYPTKYSKSRRNAKLMVVGVWMLALVISLPSLYYLPSQEKTGEENFQCKLNQNLNYAIYSSTGSFFVPLLFILVINASILSLTRRRAKMRQQLAQRASVTEKSFQSPESIVQERKKRLNKQQERKATLVLGLVVGAFVICWLPFFVTYLMRLKCHNCIPDRAFAFFFWLGYCNSAINPIIYSIFNQDFRETIKQVLAKLLCCRKS
ncbi:hypothetical protein Ciccas_009321 [Cichlidogyrus casuarinus]|uniref:G-protein coupled receptors family 1 profile domain-containing protein n=1 Tax=Cichlidogyrus casuarinus TaxID=1844966 RepID=A0ABD2PXD3_9PLAT